MFDYCLTVNESIEWQHLMPVERSVFGSREYASISEENGKGTACLYVFECQEGRVVYPFFKRSLQELPFFDPKLNAQWDIVTPEYSGPLAIDMPEGTGKAFLRHFSAFCLRNRIIAEFAHLNPWQAETELLAAEDLSFNRKIVYVDLSVRDEELWNDSFTYACQKNIRKADREGVEVFVATEEEHIVEFHRIYTHTMDRNNAAEHYYYPLTYFLSFFQRMPENAQFMLARYNGTVIAGTLYLHDRDHVYSYLGGALADYQHLRPNNAIIYATVIWAKQTEHERLVLGGGYLPEDGIFRFKKSFSPLTVPFQIYARVHIPKAYQALCLEWETFYETAARATDYFPLYRWAL